MNIKLSNTGRPLHRTWIRLLPYTTFGALLISLKSAHSLSAILIIYSLLMGVQLSAIAIYLIGSKLIARNQKKEN
ncbi:hypothetical protein Sta7437_3685 [Stanieria cyanosphaera PCC 7437]|uniref:Uncharacterized protein n=1 Tax=Stanieria cyanosphaera (strain ATCC 29371 / PCC 7437) TaxID=111780 RepID=K9XYH6_STAC7|nr:hypothetical protein [Stanieria cyanosphaera]AFZ37181.1 hypothetical protein Sta7437_3685 [Stanieria cyanosphaera PCC 7437]